MNHAAVDFLQLDPRAIERSVVFYRAYAMTCRREWQEARNADREPGASRLASAADHRLMELASALRQAGSWALLIDAPLGMDLLGEAADAFIRLNFGYGAFLAAVTDRAPGWRTEERSIWRQQLESLLSSTSQLQLGADRDLEVPPPIRHPQQQVYAAIAASFAGSHAAELARSVAERADQRNGVLPVGALGTPIRRFWAVANGLLSGDTGTTLAHLGAMSERFADQAESAMVNESLWRGGHATFEAIDLDIIGLTALSIRRFGRQEMMTSFEQRRTFDSPIALSQMLIAQDLDRLSDHDDGDHGFEGRG